MIGFIYLFLSLISVAIVFFLLELHEKEIELSVLSCVMLLAFCTGPIALIILLFLWIKEYLFPKIKQFIDNSKFLNQKIKFGKLNLKEKLSGIKNEEKIKR